MKDEIIEQCKSIIHDSLFVENRDSVLRLQAQALALIALAILASK